MVYVPHLGQENGHRLGRFGFGRSRSTARDYAGTTKLLRQQSIESAERPADRQSKRTVAVPLPKRHRFMATPVPAVDVHPETAFRIHSRVVPKDLFQVGPCSTVW